jgi:hypothetical protein
MPWRAKIAIVSLRAALLMPVTSLIVSKQSIEHRHADFFTERPCQGKVEMSYSQQSRNVLFTG